MEQESKKRKAEEAEFQSPSISILCANNCGFFGNPATHNLCSKCYKDACLAKSLTPIEALIAPAAAEPQKIDEKPKEDDAIAKVESFEASSSGEASAGKKPSKRCHFCNKKVGLLGFQCRCGEVLCSLHRYSEKHNCDFDYKRAGQDAIRKANLVVKANKLEKI